MLDFCRGLQLNCFSNQKLTPKYRKRCRHSQKHWEHCSFLLTHSVFCEVSSAIVSGPLCLGHPQQAEAFPGQHLTSSESWQERRCRYSHRCTTAHMLNYCEHVLHLVVLCWILRYNLFPMMSQRKLPALLVKNHNRASLCMSEIMTSSMKSRNTTKRWFFGDFFSPN